MANSVEFSCYGSAWICLRHYKRHSCYLILSLPLALIVAPLHATCLLVPSVLLSMSSLTASHLNSGDLDVTVNFLTEIDRLVQMIESPIFTRKFRLAAALPCALDPNSYCYAIWYQLAGACLFFLFLSFFSATTQCLWCRSPCHVHILQYVFMDSTCGCTVFSTSQSPAQCVMV